MRRPLSILAALTALTALPAPLAAEPITVFAAASLGDALTEVITAYEAQGGDSVTASFAGSSLLARQIAQGAPANVFLSANVAWMDDLEARGMVVDGTRTDLLANTLVLIGPDGSDPLTLEDIPTRLGDGFLAMALVDAVPAGIYGKAALTHLNIWPSVSPKVAQTDNVRAALALVATGEAPLGITYATDARAEPRVTVLATFPKDSHAPITYPVAAVGDVASGDTLAFLTFLASPQATAIFTSHGFTTVPEAE